MRILPSLVWLSLLSTAAGAATITRGPYLQLATSEGVILRWRTDAPTDSEVRYGPTPSTLNESVLAAEATTEHSVELSGLAPDTRYYYSVGSSSETLAGGDTGHSFVTSPLSGTAVPTRIWVLGDSGTANGNAAAVRDAFLAYPGNDRLDLALLLGDNAYESGTDSEFQDAVFEMYPTLLRSHVFWPAFGNHDGQSADSDTESGPYYDAFDLPRAGQAGGVASGTEAYYSFDYGNVHIVCLDSHDSDRLLGGDMLTWLEADLAATGQDWILAFWHHPPYSKGSHDSDTEGALIQMRENAVALLEDYGVDLVLTGHSHSYERSYLLDGHYGDSDSFEESMKVDDGDGREEGDGAYSKAALARQGAVYAVAGSSGKVSSGPLNHPAMVVSIDELGSMVLDIYGNRLDAAFLREDGSVPDHFTILKGADLFPPYIESARALGSSTVEVTFNEPLTAATAEKASNYSVDTGGVLVLGSTLQADERTVELATTELAQGVIYTLEVSGVTDTATNPVAPGEQAELLWLDPTVASFQDGVEPEASYLGTRDTFLEEASPTEVHGAATTLEVDGDDGGDSDLNVLLRWDLSGLPTGAIVDHASITVTVLNGSSDPYELQPLLVPWVENEADWNEASSGQPWHAAGATGAADRGSTVLGTMLAGATGTYTAQLTAAGRATVQGWIADPTTNYGVILSGTEENDGLDFASREAADPGTRPRLDVTYHLPATPDAEPPSVPSGLQVTAIGTDFVDLEWQASTDNAAVGYYTVYRDGSPLGSTAATVYTDATVAPDSSYDYQVEAVDTSGNPSTPSGPVPATTDPVACSAPDGNTLSLENDTVTDEQTFEVCTTISAQNAYTVGPTGRLLLRAGVSIQLGNGFSVATGGELSMWIGLPP